MEYLVIVGVILAVLLGIRGVVSGKAQGLMQGVANQMTLCGGTCQDATVGAILN